MKYSDDKNTSFVFDKMPVALLIIPVLGFVTYMASPKPTTIIDFYVVFGIMELIFFLVCLLIYTKFIKCFEISLSEHNLILHRYFSKRELIIDLSNIKKITLSYYMIIRLKNGQTLLFKSAVLPGIKESLLDIKGEVNIEIGSMYD